MQAAQRKLDSKFITTPKPLAQTGSVTERSALVKFLQRILTPTKPPSNWFKKRKYAYKRILGISNGRFELVSNVYHGNFNRHWLRCTECGTEIHANVHEIRDLGASLCPLCFPEEIDDLSRFGSAHRVASFFYHLSNGMLIAPTEQDFYSADNWYRWYCVADREPFHASAKYVLKSLISGRGHGCPICTLPARYSPHNVS